MKTYFQSGNRLERSEIISHFTSAAMIPNTFLILDVYFQFRGQNNFIIKKIIVTKHILKKTSKKHKIKETFFFGKWMLGLSRHTHGAHVHFLSRLPSTFVNFLVSYLCM